MQRKGFRVKVMPPPCCPESRSDSEKG
ncbi:uncharacterized protein isoform X2 [Macaca fascicularis]